MEALGIDTKLLIAQIVNFALFLFIFKKFISKPFLEYMRSERNKEEEKERLLKEVADREAQLTVREQQIVKEAHEQASKIVNEAKKTATKLRDEELKKAHNDAELIRKKAKEQIDEERKKMYGDVRTHIISTSSSLTKHVLGEYVTPTVQKDLFDKLAKALRNKDLYEN